MLPSLTPLNPDDHLKLQQCAIEHLQKKFPILQSCEVYVTPTDGLAIESFDNRRLALVQNIFNQLGYWAWRMVGVSHIDLFCQERYVIQVETRRKLEESLLNRLEFDQSLECNLLLMATATATLEAPAQTTTQSTAPQIKELITKDEIVSRLQAASGMDATTVLRFMNVIEMPAFKTTTGELLFPTEAGLEIIRQWQMKAEQAYLEATETTAQAPTPSTASKSVKSKPRAKAKGMVPTNGKSPTPKASRRVTKSPIANLEVSLKSYSDTVKLVLEQLAPGEPQAQVNLARDIVAGANEHLGTLVKLYTKRGRDSTKSQPGLIREFNKFIDSAVEAPEPVAAS